MEDVYRRVGRPEVWDGACDLEDVGCGGFEEGITDGVCRK